MESLLLREVIWRRAPRLAVLVNRLGEIPLTDDQREELREALADELLGSGLGPDGEPTSRGRELDRLISRLAEF